MKKFWILLSLILVALGGIIWLQHSSSLAVLLWHLSKGGSWLLPLVLVSALLDSAHPCSFSILLITIAFLFGLQLDRKQILKIGSTYIIGIFLSYLLIGLGILHALNFFNTPHFMGKLGASLLIAFGILNIANYLFPKFPVKLKLPQVSHKAMAKMIEKASISAALILGILVGICQFPCMGGPYLMVIGLLHDQLTYARGVGYLTLYNLILILPLAAVLLIAANKAMVNKIEYWKKHNLSGLRLWAGLAMIVIGVLILYI